MVIVIVEVAFGCSWMSLVLAVSFFMALALVPGLWRWKQSPL